MNHLPFAWLPHGADFIWIFLVVVILFGAEKLPKLARGLGKSLGEFKKAKEEFEKEIHNATNETEKKPEQQNLISGNVPTPVTPVPSASADDVTKKS